MIAAELPEWLDVETARMVLIGVLAVLVVLALLVLRAIQKVVLRLVVLAALVAVGISVWAQRAELDECSVECSCTLYGQEVVISDDRLRQLCAERAPG